MEFIPHAAVERTSALEALDPAELQHRVERSEIIQFHSNAVGTTAELFRQRDNCRLPRVQLSKRKFVVEVQRDEEFVASPISPDWHPELIVERMPVRPAAKEPQVLAVPGMINAMIGEPQSHLTTHDGFCIYIDTICQGPIPVERDGDGKPVVYPTREEAEREIAGDCIERLRQFLAGERDFSDATTVEEYVVPVSQFADGSITDEDERVFPNPNW